MRALFGSLTTRGRSFLAAGGTAIVCGLVIPETDLVRVGALLVILPMVSAMIARRSRYRLACSRRLDPPRVPAGTPATVTARLENVSRRRTAILLAEDVTPSSLGRRPRYVLDEIEAGGSRELKYQVHPDVRGKFTIGPLRVRVADAFGLVEITRSFAATSTLVVTPKIYPLPRASAASSWLGEGDGGMRTISAIGEDDAAPRAYQDGDGLRRVHWRSTARYGQLMVRREEHQWRNSASVFLDTRRSAHSGSGTSATFEFAVSAAASIGAHLTGEGFRARLITEAGEIAPRGTFAGHPARHARGHQPVARRQRHARHGRAGQRGRAADRRARAAVRRGRPDAGREQARQRARDGPAAGRLGVDHRRGERGYGAGGADPVRGRLAGRGRRGGHAAGGHLAAAAPARRPAAAGQRSRRRADMTANARMTLTVAVACVLTSVGLYPLFNGTTWFYAGIGAVITVAACGALSRLRALPVLVGLAIGAVGLLLYLNLLFEARHSWVIIPTPDSIRQLWALAGSGFSDTRRYAPPVPELPQLRGLVLLAAGGIGIAALVTDLIAVRLRSAALAGLPLLVLFTVPITMNAQHEGVGTTVVFCLGAAGYMAMLSADGRDRIRVWGRLVSLWKSGSMSGTAARPAPARRVAGREAGPDTRALAAAGRRVGLASVVLALFVPLIVPGLHASKLFSSGPGIGGSGGSSSGAAVALPDALQQTLRQLQKTRPTEVLRYVTSAPAQLMKDDPPYLQTYVYDNLTDSGLWTGDYTAGERQASAIPQPAGVTNPAALPRFSIAVDVADDALTSRSQPVFLPLPYPATQVTTPAGDWRADPELMVFSPSSVSVRAYQATFAEVDPTAAELTGAASPLRVWRLTSPSRRRSRQRRSGR